MTTKAIVDHINQLLAGEHLTYQDVEPLLDRVIDDINSQLNTRYPAYSELKIKNNDGAPPIKFECFPDRYIRLVLIPGAAYYFYIMDEEGIDTAPAYREMYQRGLFMMLRDYVEYDKRYQAHCDVGSLHIHPDIGYTGGVWVSGDIWKL